MKAAVVLCLLALVCGANALGWVNPILFDIDPGSTLDKINPDDMPDNLPAAFSSDLFLRYWVQRRLFPATFVPDVLPVNNMVLVELLQSSQANTFGWGLDNQFNQVITLTSGPRLVPPRVMNAVIVGFGPMVMNKMFIEEGAHVLVEPLGCQAVHINGLNSYAFCPEGNIRAVVEEVAWADGRFRAQLLTRDINARQLNIPVQP
jgi:hypothetical protein